ncbi:hypothetical protein [Nocardia cyriacigeorgica]|uniref:hypothetical protein n=1 Tax=Nocardia cyriacigeorgica TaxID=135487 RepID=UPI0028125D3A|nr:hypothetical protein [Nocardia cyriacigeorgica]
MSAVAELDAAALVADFFAAGRDAGLVEVVLRARVLAAVFFAGRSPVVPVAASGVDPVVAASVEAVVTGFGAAFFAGRFFAGAAVESAVPEAGVPALVTSESAVLLVAADVAAVLFAAPRAVAFAAVLAAVPAFFAAVPVFFAAAAVPVFSAAVPAFFAAVPAFLAAAPDAAPEDVLLVAREARVVAFLAAAFAGVFAAPFPVSVVAESVVLEAECLSGSAAWLMCRFLGWGVAPGRRAGRSAAG